LSSPAMLTKDSMKTFKTFLSEGTTEMFNPATFKLPALLTMYENAGYELTGSDRSSFKSVKYAGYKGKKHAYDFLCFNDNNDGEDNEYYIARMYLELHQAGLCLEPSGTPEAEGTKEAMTKKFASL
jgi:hypothetical protein